MAYKSLESCLEDLEKNRQLVRIKEEVDPELEMAAIHLRVYEAGGPALLFENIKGSRYRAASNVFGTMERSRFIFRDTFRSVQQLISLKTNPAKALKNPLKNLEAVFAGIHAFPLKNPVSKPVLESRIQISDLPLIKHWPMDGGAFVTLPQVFSEDMEKPGLMHSNLGMYRIQLNGNSYELNKEIGLHYQIHRGIGIHHTKAKELDKLLKVSVFVGGPPAHTLAAVMPLPEGMSELNFAGVLGGRRFRYVRKNGYYISTEADFVITGYIYPDEVKPEGPFGDHLGYYSLTHDFPVMHVEQVFARKNAIWPFTVVGRPPQEDTSFGALIHELTGEAIPGEIPGLKEVNAVDAAGVHPLLLAIGSERYTPFQDFKKPAELLTIAHHILGSGQLSLAKYLWIAAEEGTKLSTSRIPEFFQHILERVDWSRDLHFQTKTTIDTLDYSGTGLNTGSKLIVAACGPAKRTLAAEPADCLKNLKSFYNPKLVFPGVVSLQGERFKDYETAEREMDMLHIQLRDYNDLLTGTPLLVICDDSNFVSQHINNFLWISFTRSNPSHDIYGVNSFVEHKHWGCTGPVIIDARIKPHHAPPLEKDPSVEQKINRIFNKGGSLYGVLK